MYLVTNKCFLRKVLKDENIWFENGISLGEDQMFVCQYLQYVSC